MPKITAALSALLAHFFPDLTDFQKHQPYGTELQRQEQDQKQQLIAAS